MAAIFTLRCTLINKVDQSDDGAYSTEAYRTVA